MSHNLVLYGIAATLVLLTGDARSQLGVDGARLAQPGRYEVIYEQFTSPFLAAFDWAEAESARVGSPLTGKVATDRMAAMGHSSCGGLAVILGADPRVATIGVFNGSAWGSFHLNNDPKSVHIDRLHGPVLLVYGVESPMMPLSAEGFEAIGNVPVFYGVRRNTGHALSMDHPGGGEISNVASSWLEWTLKQDAEAGAMFVGEHCGLCADANWDVRSKRLD